MSLLHFRFGRQSFFADEVATIRAAKCKLIVDVSRRLKEDEPETKEIARPGEPLRL